MSRAGKRHLWTPVLIAVVVLAPLVMAVMVYFQPGWFSFGHSNHGRLVRPPVKIQAAALPRLFAAEPLPADYFHGFWTLVYIGGSRCGAPCRAALYATRQARIAAGEDMRRVQRLYVVRGRSEAAGYLRRSQPDLTVVEEATTDAGKHFVRQFTAVQPVGGIYLVDPNGLLMMTYPPGADPAGLLKDLRHLLNANPA